MGGNIVLNIIKTSIAALICVLLLILVNQRDHIEERMRSIEVGQNEQEDRDEAAERAFRQLDRRVERIETRLESLQTAMREGAISIAPGGDGGTAGTPPDADVDPRTLPYWERPDNLLVDLDREPRAPSDAPRGGTIQFWVGSNLRSLNPYVNSDVYQVDRVCIYVYEYLASRSLHDPDRWVPGLANCVTVSPDKTEFTIHLRKGVYWHAPTLSSEERQGDFAWLAQLPPQEFSAHDVKFTFDVVRNKNSEASDQASYLVDLVEFEVVDRYTVRVKWKEKNYYSLGSTLGLLMILPRHIFGRDAKGNELDIDAAAGQFQQHWYNQRMCGTGPMRFEEFVDNGHIRLERHEDYWGIKPVFDELLLKIVENPEMRLSLLKTGKIDLMKVEPSQWRTEYLDGSFAGSLQKLEAEGEFNLHMITAYAYRYIGWNQKRAIFRDRRVRRALAHAFPKQRLVRDIEFGLAAEHDSPVHPDTGYYNKQLEQFPFDLKRASAMLDEAGWTMNERGVREKVIDGVNTELRFKILMPNSRPVYRQFGLLYQKELRQIGVIMDLDLREWEKLKTQLDNKDFDACSLGWGLSYDSDPSQIWHPREAELPRSSNHIAYASKELGEVIEALKGEFDPEKRKELHHRFQEIIVGDQAYLFLIVPKEPWFVNSRLGNQFFSPLRPQEYLLPWFVQRDR